MAEPMWRQIADGLRRKIESGDLSQGDPLPTEDELISQHEASRNTVRQAIQHLAAQELVITRAGKGTLAFAPDPYVVELTGEPEKGQGAGDVVVYQFHGPEQRPTQPPAQPEPTALEVKVVVADQQIAQLLEIPPGGVVISRRQERSMEGRPWSIQTSFYPAELADEQGADRLRMAKNIEEGTVAYLRALGIVQVGYHELISMRPLKDDEMRFFTWASDVFRIFENRRIAYDTTGRPIRVSETIFPARQNKLIISVGQVPDHLPGQTSPGK